MPRHYLNQYWLVANWTLGNNFQWNHDLNSSISSNRKDLKILSMKCWPFHPCPNALINSKNFWLLHQVKIMQMCFKNINRSSSPSGRIIIGIRNQKTWNKKYIFLKNQFEKSSYNNHQTRWVDYTPTSVPPVIIGYIRRTLFTIRYHWHCWPFDLGIKLVCYCLYSASGSQNISMG